jgi:hypothetical protein
MKLNCEVKGRSLITIATTCVVTLTATYVEYGKIAVEELLSWVV